MFIAEEGTPITMIARGCNEKHENNSGKASAITLEHHDKKL